MLTLRGIVGFVAAVQVQHGRQAVPDKAGTDWWTGWGIAKQKVYAESLCALCKEGLELGGPVGTVRLAASVVC